MKSGIKFNLDYLLKQLAGIVFLCILTIAVIGIFGIRPKFADIKAAKISTASAQAKITVYQQKQKDLAALKNRIDDYQASYEALSEFLPTESKHSEMLAIIEDLAKQDYSKVNVTNIMPTQGATQEFVVAGQAVKLKKVYQTASYSMTVQGDFNKFDNKFGANISLMAFLADLEKSLRPINIKSVRISGGGEQVKGNPAFITALIDLDTYYLPREEVYGQAQ